MGKLIVNKLPCVWLLSELNPFVGWLLETTQPGGFIVAAKLEELDRRPEQTEVAK